MINWVQSQPWGPPAPHCSVLGPHQPHGLADAVSQLAGGAVTKLVTEIPSEVTITLTETGGGKGVAGQDSGGPGDTQAGRAPSRRC